jgi:hypothetical protein
VISTFFNVIFKTSSVEVGKLREPLARRARGPSVSLLRKARWALKIVNIVTLLVLAAGCSASPTAPTSTTRLDESPRFAGSGPTISSVQPATAVVGIAEITLTVTGTNFWYQPPNGAHVTTWLRWEANGLATELQAETTVVSATELTARIPGSLLRQVGTAQLRVANGDSMSVSGGGSGYPLSNPFSFEVTAPVPVINSISPPSATVGAEGLELTVTGTDFIAAALPGAFAMTWLRWSANGVNHDLVQTKVVSSTELRVPIPSALLRSPGTVYLLVENGDPMGVTDGYEGYPKSNPIPFQITGPGNQ